MVDLQESHTVSNQTVVCLGPADVESAKDEEGQADHCYVAQDVPGHDEDRQGSAVDTFAVDDIPRMRQGALEGQRQYRGQSRDANENLDAMDQESMLLLRGELVQIA